MDISLDEMIQRERRAKAESTNNPLRPSAPLGPKGSTAKRHGGSGIGKSPSPAPSSMNSRWTHDLHHKNNPLASRITKSTPLPSSITPSVAAQLSNNRLFTALHGAITPTPPPPPPPPPPTAPKNGADAGLSIRGASRQVSGFSIKGLAGPFVVRASNLAPGTTAEDVKTAMLPLGKIVSCIILTANPTVMAEIVFEKKDAADRCIEQYNNQIADSRRLHVVLHNGPPIGKPSSFSSKFSSSSSLVDHNTAREEADRQRRLANQQHLNGNVVDGTYGFKAPILYSDTLVSKRGRGFQR